MPRTVEDLIAQLSHVGPLSTEDVGVPCTETVLSVTRPANIDTLLDHSADDPEQNLPYWAEIWPSGIALAGAISKDPAAVSGKRVLELGCGVGITAAIALEVGADLLATDYSPYSLTLCALTCLRHSGREPHLMQANWRDPVPSFLANGEQFPVVLAADALYERRDIEPLLDLIGRAVTPDGIFWLAEPQRPPARIFLEQAAKRGWRGPTSAWEGPWPDPNDDHVVVRVHRLSRHS